jgi:aspartate kinase
LQPKKKKAMKIMKFGGTSVGKPERMHAVAELITKDSESKIVVLSALSGTTNALVSIGDALAAGDRNQAKKNIDTLEAHYHAFIKQSLSLPNISNS